MRCTMIGELIEKVGQDIKVQGWPQRLRDQKKMQFLIARDRTGLVQVANERGCDPALAVGMAPPDGQAEQPQYPRGDIPVQGADAAGTLTAEYGFHGLGQGSANRVL